MADSIKIPAQYDDMFKDLCTDRKNRKVFETYKDLLLFAAAVGKNKGSRIPYSKSNLDPVRLSYFRGEYDIDTLNCIALSETSDPKILSQSSDDDKIKILEEYMNSGLELIQNNVYENPGSWEDHIIDMILAVQKKDINPLDDITNAWE
jgi:dnd system-associated protein 4